MLNKVANLGGLFAQKSEHPLADARELRKVLSELPRDNAFKALDEIAGWSAMTDASSSCSLLESESAARLRITSFPSMLLISIAMERTSSEN